jgi:hypothetical protein
MNKSSPQNAYWSFGFDGRGEISLSYIKLLELVVNNGTCKCHNVKHSVQFIPTFNMSFNQFTKKMKLIMNNLNEFGIKNVCKDWNCQQSIHRTQIMGNCSPAKIG